ncbi:uncharacterized protein [Diabrotica undecimpunctata]|uniref:uncharacterized protein n=1 Tax=Diabrotica undecimpunctata TaxID=50387 RepID=UPI003B63B4E5
MTFDQHLNWKEHIKKLAIECQARLNILKSLSKKVWGADKQTMLSLYRTLIRSKLDYGAIAYSLATESSLKTLDSIHNTAPRIVLEAYRTTPIESLYCEAAEPSLYHRRTYLKLTYAIKSNANPNNHTFKYDHLNRLSTCFSNKPRLHKPFYHRIKMDLSSLNTALPVLNQF